MNSFPGRLALASTVLISLSAGANDLENITVTASRTAANIDDVGSTITLVTREQIRQRSADTLADLLRDVAGIAVSRQGGTGTLAQMRMRGAEANHVLVLIDGVEANDLAQDDAFNFSHILANDIERIEIVRGPQSALWGSDALSGVINVITEPGAGQAPLTAAVESGSHNAMRGALSFSQHVDIGAISGGITHARTDGTNISRQGDERDGYRNTTARLSGRFSATDRINLSLSWRTVDTLTDYDDIDFITTGLPIDAPNTTDSLQHYGKFAVTFSQSELLDHHLTLTRTDTENINHTSSPIDDVTRGLKDTMSWQTNLHSGSHTFSLIGEHERNDYEQRGEVTFFGNPNKDIEATTDSVAAEYRFNGDLFDVSASARRDVNSEFRNANTWRLTALWHATGDVDLFASTGKSIKNPTFTDRFGFYDTFIGNPDLKPEQSRAYELGARWRAPSANFHVAASYYKSVLRDEINGFAFDPATSSFTAENLDGESDRSGTEIEFGWQPIDEVSIDGSYTWLDATESGLDEIRRAGDIGTLRVNYHLGRANINVGINYNGSQWDNYFPPVPPFQERVHLSGYTLVNVAGQYRLTDNVTLTARGENLLDESYEEVFGFRGSDFAAYAGIRLTLD